MTVLRPEFPDHGSPFSRQRERDRKTAAIRSAASKRFIAQGFQGTRLEDIASDLGLTKTSIAYYFASKDELAESVFLTAAEFLEDAVKAAGTADADAGERVLAVFEAYSDQLIDALDGRRDQPAQLQELGTLPEEARSRIVSRLSAAVGSVDAMVLAWMNLAPHGLGRSEPVTFCLIALLDWLKTSAGTMSRAEFSQASSVLLDVLRSGLTCSCETLAPIRPQFSPGNDLPQIFDRKARNKMKREAFLKAGIRFFNAYGFDGVSLADVAKSLGVTRGAFYYHIPDKESFLDQCMEHSLEVVEATLDSAADAHSGLGFIHRVLFDLIYTQASGVTPLIRLGLMTALPIARQNRLQARLRNISRRLGDAHAAAIADGAARELDTGTVEAILTNILFLNDGFTLSAANSLKDWRISEEPQSATNDYLHVLLYGLTAEPR